MDSSFLWRLKKEGYEISFNPRADGKCFFHAAAFQLGLGTETVHDSVFDYLERHQFDCKGNDRKMFLCDADLSGEELPMTWADTVKKLKHDYATDVVIRALADVFRCTIVIVTVHGREDYVKRIEPQSGVSVDTLHFAHTGWHYMALRQISLREATSESTKQPETSSSSVKEEGFKMKQKWKLRKNQKMECWESEWKEEYTPGKSLWKGRSVEDDAEFRMKSETRERHDPLKASDSNVIIISDTEEEADGNEKLLGTPTRKLKRKRHCNSQSVVDLTDRLSGLSSNDDSPVKESKKARQTATSVAQSPRKSLFTSRQLYHQNDKRLPIFSSLKSKSDMSKREREEAVAETLVTLTVTQPTASQVCKIPPRRVMQNRAFIVDTSKLKDVADVLSDDTGSWINNGQHTFHYEKNDEGYYERVGRRASFDTSSLSRPWVTLHRHYYFNRDANDFHRIVSFITDDKGERHLLTKVEYQFTDDEHQFVITPHGNDTKTKKPYTRTQKSTLTALKNELKSNQPRIALDKVAEGCGGLMSGHSAGSWPRDITQAYNLQKKDDASSCKLSKSDPYLALVMECKEQAKDSSSAYIRKVQSAPEPIVILGTNEQLDDLVSFCTNSEHFGIMSIDPTFDLGPFSVTTTTYEHLLLISRRGGVHPVMIGPMMIHQNKGKDTYFVFVDYLLNSRPQLKNLRVLGTDGELALSSPFLERCPDLTHLLCFIHFKNNIVNHLKTVGVDETNRKCIIADIFGQQQGTRFEEGLVDSGDVDEFKARLQALKDVWNERLGEKGLRFHTCFVKNKADSMKAKMLRPLRIRAGLGNPPKAFFTNRVECGNSLLSRETDHTESPVDSFVAKMQGLCERQARNIRWAIINKGPYRLHPSLQHFEMAEDEWVLLTSDEKDAYINMVLGSSVSLTALPVREPENESQKESIMDVLNVNEDDKDETVSVSGLSMLAKAAMSVLSHGKESAEPAHHENLTTMIPLKDFKTYLINQPDATVEGIYGKSIELLGKNSAVVMAPGCDKKARMVESRRYKERPHLVTPGKQKGEYRCEKNCPHFNGIRICSHTVVTAQQNGELLDFLNYYKQSCAKRGINLSLTVRTDMPKNPGRKGGVPSTARRASPKLPINERVKRSYPQNSIPNVNPFRLKQMNFRIKVCQGCRGSLQSSSGTVADAPFDFCVARKERRTYKDPQTGQLCTPTRESDAHYHLRVACIQAAEPSFVPYSLVIPDGLLLTECHKDYITNEFGLRAC